MLRTGAQLGEGELQRGVTRAGCRPGFAGQTCCSTVVASQILASTCAASEIHGEVTRQEQHRQAYHPDSPRTAIHAMTSDDPNAFLRLIIHVTLQPCVAGL